MDNYVMNMNSTSNNRSAVKDESSAVKAVQSVIAEHAFLKGLKPEHLRVLADNAMRMRYEPGEIIFCEGAPANRFYLIEKGKVSLESHRKHEPTTAIFFYGTRLREACEQDHDLGYELMKRMTQLVIQRLQATRKQLLAL